ncbi:MAG: hypothetical protein ABJF01_12435 [bacterium]
MKASLRYVLGAALLSAVWAAACKNDDPASPVTTPPATTPALPQGVEALRAALEPYTSFAMAKGAGFTSITDCMSSGDLGAMGIHFGKTSTFDAVIDSLHPEIVIYEPGTNGEMSLVGVEFVIPYTSLPKTATAPVLFGQKFLQNDGFQLWGLHVWTHRTNPSGLFASWNPRVHC